MVKRIISRVCCLVAGLYAFAFSHGQIEYEKGVPLGIISGTPYEIVVDRSVLSFIEGKDHEPVRNSPMQFAIPVALSLNPSNSGEMISRDGEKIWIIILRSEGAKSLNLIFEPYDVPEGSKLYVYDREKNTVRGAFTEKNNSSSRILPVAPVRGDEIIVEYHVPLGKEMDGTLGITQVGHDFLGVAGIGNTKDNLYDRSQPCNVDVTCRENDQINEVRRSVCRLIVNGIQICTGVLLNSTDHNSPPLMLTAEHCITDSYDASRTIMFFNYESPWCGGPDGYAGYTMSGTEFLKSDNKLDYGLVRLNEHPPITYEPYYAGWDFTGDIPEKTYTIHHPGGDVKKISSDDDSPETGSYLNFDVNVFWKVLRWEEGATEGGSSGAPLFTPEGRVTGILSGGLSVCGTPYNDYFLKLNSAFVKDGSTENSFRSWFDPKGYGFLKLQGRDPYKVNQAGNETAVNFPEISKNLLALVTAPGEGYMTGLNSYNITGYGELFLNDRTRYILGADVVPGKVRYIQITDSVEFRVYTESGGKPGALLAARKIGISNARENVPLWVQFRNALQVSGNFFICWILDYTEPVFPDYRQFTVYHSSDLIDPGLNCAWFRKDNIWDSFGAHPGMPGSWSLKVSALLTESNLYTDVGSTAFQGRELVLYPNPASESFTILSGGLPEKLRVTMADYAGRTYYSAIHYINGHDHFSVMVPDFPPGVYVVRIEGNGVHASGKIIIDVK
ncbi:MAG: T9SS type A sorting domain-containing protein [Bacteroidales bacterium]|jgi:hypothetical protein|nr:T9SS type A sorting domain-containing protein [Bacteroidales bacterium]